MKEELKKFIKDALTNPDGLSFSSKRIGGFISLFATITYAFTIKVPSSDVMFTLAGLTVAFFGLTSVDFKSMISNKVQTGDTDPVKV